MIVMMLVMLVLMLAAAGYSRWRIERAMQQAAKPRAVRDYLRRVYSIDD